MKKQFFLKLNIFWCAPIFFFYIWKCSCRRIFVKWKRFKGLFLFLPWLKASSCSSLDSDISKMLFFETYVCSNSCPFIRYNRDFQGIIIKKITNSLLGLEKLKKYRKTDEFFKLPCYHSLLLLWRAKSSICLLCIIQIWF